MELSRRDVLRASIGAILLADSVKARIPRGFSRYIAATQIFSYASNFSDTTIGRANSATYDVNNNIEFFQVVGHASAGAWYRTKQPPGPFTTTFTFDVVNLNGGGIRSAGMTFCVQNTVTPPAASSAYGLTFADDANACGYSGAPTQNPPQGSIAVKFDTANIPNRTSSVGAALPASTGLYMNGAPVINPASVMLTPCNDMIPYGINFYNGDTFQVTIVYDGSLLTMVILDTTTLAQARFAWPLNLANSTNATGNYIGFTGGNATTTGSYWGQFHISKWAYYSGYNTRLATPIFSPAPGQYAGAQTVTISYPAGSTCYYTTNGLMPTSASTQYTGPLSVTANEVIQAVAIQSGFTDSLVALATYKIGTSNTINFASFAAGNLIPAAYAYLSGTTYLVTDTTPNTSGAVWFPAPVNITSGWSTSFQLGINASAQGMCFVIQNSAPAYVALSSVRVTGTAGQISFASNTSIAAGQYLYVAGALGGSGGITGYADPTLYYVSAATSTTATLQSNSLTALTTTVGTLTGATFSVLQESQSGGPTVYSDGNVSLGYGGLAGSGSIGLTNSVAIAFNSVNALPYNDPANAVGLYLNGVQPTGAYFSTGLTFSAAALNVVLSYSGTTLSININNGAFTHSWTVDIPGTVGGSTAYVGFTGGSGGAAAIQSINSWTGF